MGKRWDAFREKLDYVAFGIPAPEQQDEKKPEVPSRSWRNELLTDEERQDLEAVVEMPGYEVLRKLYENALEGYITYMIQIDPADEKSVLAAHKCVHFGYLFNKSVETQVSVYMRLSEAERQEAADLKAALSKTTGDPLENADVMAKLLNPIHQPGLAPVPQKLKKVVTTPLDTMLAKPVIPEA